MRTNAAVIAAVLALSGCSSAVPDATGDDDAHDSVVTLAADELATELVTSPAHDAARVLAQVELVYDAPSAAAVDVATSVDGLTWTDWTSGAVDTEASSDGTFVATVDVADGPRYWRVRAHDGGAAQ